MKRIILIVLALCNLFICAAQTSVIVDVKANKSIWVYSIHLDSFDSDSTPKSIWEVRKNAALNDFTSKQDNVGLQIQFLYGQMRLESDVVHQFVKNECEKRKDEIDSVFRTLLSPYKCFLLDKTVHYRLHFSNNAELLGVVLFIKRHNSSDEEFPEISDAVCLELYRKLNGMKLLTQWSNRDFYWASYMSRLAL
jgi:hypothetical protein